jgi:hypothetical protein
MQENTSAANQPQEKEGDSCTAPDGRSGFKIADGRGGFVCVAGESYEEARAAHASSVGQGRNAPESQASIDRNNPAR